MSEVSDEAARQFERCQEIERDYPGAERVVQEGMLRELDDMRLTVDAIRVADALRQHIREQSD